MAMLEVNKENFKDETSEGVVLVDFWAPWCGVCKNLAPILDSLSEELDGKAKIVKVNVDEDPEIAGKFQIMGLPTVVVLKDGQATGTYPGLKSKEFYIEKIEN